MDCTRSSGGERIGGVNIVIVGDRETNASLGDGMWDHDRAYDDSKVDRIKSSRGE
jgi:hypothetical protein